MVRFWYIFIIKWVEIYIFNIKNSRKIQEKVLDQYKIINNLLFLHDICIKIQAVAYSWQTCRAKSFPLTILWLLSKTKWYSPLFKKACPLIGILLIGVPFPYLFIFIMTLHYCPLLYSSSSYFLSILTLNKPKPISKSCIEKLQNKRVFDFYIMTGYAYTSRLSRWSLYCQQGS